MFMGGHKNKGKISSSVNQRLSRKSENDSSKDSEDLEYCMHNNNHKSVSIEEEEESKEVSSIEKIIDDDSMNKKNMFW